MGRKSVLHSIKDPIIKKNKHRFSDSKYRQNVQYLYGLMRKNFEIQSTKDCLLNTVLVNIDKMEAEIVELSDENLLEYHRSELTKLYKLEEHVWKSKKKPSEWWLMMEDVLTELLENEGNADSVLKNFSEIFEKNGSCTFEEVKCEVKRLQSNKTTYKKKKSKKSMGNSINDTVPDTQHILSNFAEECLEKCSEPDYLLNNAEWTP